METVTGRVAGQNQFVSKRSFVKQSQAAKMKERKRSGLRANTLARGRDLISYLVLELSTRILTQGTT